MITFSLESFTKGVKQFIDCFWNQKDYNRIKVLDSFDYCVIVFAHFVLAGIVSYLVHCFHSALFSVCMIPVVCLGSRTIFAAFLAFVLFPKIEDSEVLRTEQTDHLRLWRLLLLSLTCFSSLYIYKSGISILMFALEILLFFVFALVFAIRYKKLVLPASIITGTLCLGLILFFCSVLSNRGLFLCCLLLSFTAFFVAFKYSIHKIRY